MFKLTQEQYLQYLRIAIYGLAGAIGHQAFLDGSTGQWVLTAVLGGATLLWTMYATRLAAKINELVGAEVITTQVAEKMKDVATNDAVVISNVETKPAT